MNVINIWVVRALDLWLKSMGVPIGTPWGNNLQADGLQSKCAVRIPAYLSPQVLLIRPSILVNRCFVEKLSSLVIQESVSISPAE